MPHWAKSVLIYAGKFWDIKLVVEGHWPEYWIKCQLHSRLCLWLTEPDICRCPRHLIRCPYSCKWTLYTKKMTHQENDQLPHNFLSIAWYTLLETVLHFTLSLPEQYPNSPRPLIIKMDLRGDSKEFVTIELATQFWKPEDHTFTSRESQRGGQLGCHLAYIGSPEAEPSEMYYDGLAWSKHNGLYAWSEESWPEWKDKNRLVGLSQLLVLEEIEIGPREGCQSDSRDRWVFFWMSQGQQGRARELGCSLTGFVKLGLSAHQRSAALQAREAKQGPLQTLGHNFGKSDARRDPFLCLAHFRPYQGSLVDRDSINNDTAAIRKNPILNLIRH